MYTYIYIYILVVSLQAYVLNRYSRIPEARPQEYERTTYSAWFTLY